MKFVLFFGLLSFAMAYAAHAQSLDIGGVELRLGQEADEALRSLSSYQVQHTGGVWIVTQKVGNQYQLLGELGAKDNIITFIAKSFDMNENEAAPEAFTRASNETRRRGGMTCSTREVEYADGLTRAFETQCGPYKLSYAMPFKTPYGKSVLGSVSISVRKK